MIMTRNASAVKEGLQSYCEKVYSYSNINQILMLKNLWLLLFLVFYRKLYRLFYTWHHHSSWKLKTRLNKIIHKEFYFKTSRQHYKFIVLGDEITFFLKHVTKRKTWYTENEVISMLQFLIDNIFVKFIGHIFQQIICISIARNCAHLLFDDFLYIVSLWGFIYTKKLSQAT
jgi:hypothetical protein